MIKKFFVLMLAAALLLGITAGCTEQKATSYEGVEAVENLVEDDNLDAALDELSQLEEFYGP